MEFVRDRPNAVICVGVQPLHALRKAWSHTRRSLSGTMPLLSRVLLSSVSEGACLCCWMLQMLLLLS